MNPIWLQQFINWLDATPFSQAIKNVLILVPGMQSVHIMSVAVVLGAMMIGFLDYLQGVLHEVAPGG